VLRLLIAIALVLVLAQVLGGPAALESTVNLIKQILEGTLAFLLQIVYLIVQILEGV
jgi:type IV secretory pathway VirB2 component (pilin)